MPNLPFPYDFERVIDDWVFMCFFVGNDFLPHLPSLEIREGAIDRLVNLYKKSVYKTGGFLTDSGLVNPERVQLIMQDLGEMEDDIFKDRQARELEFRARAKAKKRREQGWQNRAPKWQPQGVCAPQGVGGGVSMSGNDVRHQAADMRVAGMNNEAGAGRNSVHEKLKGLDNDKALQAMMSSGKQDLDKTGVKRQREEDEDEETPDEVRLWEDGFKDRYYESKFDVGTEDIEFRYRIAAEYAIGLCWVLRYYYQGCSSWEWYFPYHYAPFASDFINIGDVKNEFPLDTKPFKPLEQLMAVFPAASRSHVPGPWGELMMDPYSPIIDFYPVDFKIDLNGKKYAWQGVALLPFVDEKRLHLALESFYPKLTEAEVARNIRGDDRLFVREGYKGFGFVKPLFDDNLDQDKELSMPAAMFDGLSGTVLWSHDSNTMSESVQSPVRGLQPVHNNRVICVRYRDPAFEKTYIFPALRLEGAVDPPNVLRPGDIGSGGNSNWRPRGGFGQERRDFASVGRAGHRMLDFNMARGGGGGKYSHVPPPVQVGDFQFQDGNINFGGGGGGGRREWGGHRGGRDDRGYGGGNRGGRDGGYGGGNYGGGGRGNYGGHGGGGRGYNGGGYGNNRGGWGNSDRGGGGWSNNRGGGGYQGWSSNQGQGGQRGGRGGGHRGNRGGGGGGGGGYYTSNYGR